MSAEKKKWDGTEVALAIALGFLWLPFGLLWASFVLRTVWNWWIPTTLPVQPLTLTSALGIWFVWSLFRRSKSSADDEGPLEGVVRAALTALLEGALTLGIAGLAYLLVF